MTVKRRKKGGFSGGRTVTVAFSLCLLAVVTMIGMYTVGKSDQQRKELEEKAAEAQEEAKALEQAQKGAEEKAERGQEDTEKAASGNASRDKQGEALADAEEEQDIAAGMDEAAVMEEGNGAELESEFAENLPDPEGTGETVILDETQAASSSDAVSEEPELSFSPETDHLLWPVAGKVILDYSMDKTVYFTTLDQYKYNPAIIVQGSLDENVMSAAPGKITKVETLEETGMTVTMDIGDGYEVIYGQLKELPVKEGDYLQAGETVGYVSEPTRYYTKEGCNVYFEVRKDGESIDPIELLQ